MNAFNRTILELKHDRLKVEYVSRVTFNRTILELKQQSSVFSKRPAKLLIVPFWN